MNHPLRIVQLIDSLEAGGAERMAVNYANTLSEVISFSALIATRKEGALKSQLSDKAAYLFLNKQGKLGLKAVWTFRKFIKRHQVDVIHAHSTSFFTAVLVKLTYPKVKIIWHDHYGNSEFLNKRNSFALRVLSVFFEGIISVNIPLKNWAESNLKCSKVIYLPNFVYFKETNKNLQQTQLEGVSGKRIICLANLRAQKNHGMLLEVATRLKESHSDWSFNLVGKDFEDDYSRWLHQEILDRHLTEHVFVYGSRNDVGAILNQSDIGVLTSQSEGLPVALLEYGFYKKAVMSTSVGEIPTVLTHKETGILIPAGDADAFYTELVLLIENASFRDYLGKNLHQHIINEYSEEAVVHKYLDWLLQVVIKQ